MDAMNGRGAPVWWRSGALVLALCLGPVLPAAAVNKCSGADGKVTYTDGPCPADSRVTRIETPPPLSSGDEARARARSERVVNEARALEARQAAEYAARQRRYEAERAAEVSAQQRQAQQEAWRDEAERLVVVRPAPLIPRYRPPAVPLPPPRPKPAEQERPAPMRSYPFR